MAGDRNALIYGTTPRLRIYIWELPVRLTHWVNAFCLLVLSVTGFYISHPFIHAISSKQYIMGWVRFIHFLTAYVFLMSVILRVYWAFTGNRFASYKESFPLSKEKFSEFKAALKFYFFFRKEPPYVKGHTCLAAFSYFLVYLIFFFQIISGFALYSVSHPSGIIWTALGGWLLNIIPLPTVRLFHYFFMYIIAVFFPLHMYASWYMDPKEKNGLVSSMFSGFKFVPEKEKEL